MTGTMISFPSNGQDTKGYLALPPNGSGPAILVIQEWWGLVQHIKNMTDRYAERGFVALAPDLYHGDVATEPEHAMTLMHELEIPQASKNLMSAAEFLRSHPANSTGKVGCLGYCMGGGMTLLLASLGAIDAAAPFYGVLPSGNPDSATIKCPVQGHYAEQDNATDSVPELSQGLETAGIEAEFFIYEGTQHAFCNDDRPEVYDADAAAKSMDRTVKFMMQHLTLGDLCKTHRQSRNLCLVIPAKAGIYSENAIVETDIQISWLLYC